jgi:hypothetical protein
MASYILSLQNKSYIAAFPDVNAKRLEFTMLDGSRDIHISQSTVSVSYTFR